jgi:hypothetical protein
MGAHMGDDGHQSCDSSIPSAVISMNALMGQTSCLESRPVALFAKAYQDGAACPPTGAELLALNTWIESEFKAIPCAVKFWTGDISLAECKAEFRKSATLNISTANNSHPYLTKSANAKFRAIHDWQHIVLSADDSFGGEFSTWWNNNAPESIQSQKLVKYSDFI